MYYYVDRYRLRRRKYIPYRGPAGNTLETAGRDYITGNRAAPGVYRGRLLIKVSIPAGYISFTGIRVDASQNLINT